MEWVNAAEKVDFSGEKLRKINLFISPRSATDIYSFRPGQEQPPHKHDGDKVYFVLEGKALFKMGEEELELGKSMAVVVPPDKEHGVSNPGPKPLVLLVFVAPPF